jgi:prevent-host-death family protein
VGEISVRDLRNEGGRIIERVLRGETLTVTRDGRPVAELRPLPRRPLSAEALLARWRRLAPVDPVRLRSDLEAVLDGSV